MNIRLPQLDGSLQTYVLKADPLRPLGPPPQPWIRSIYAAAHVVIDPLARVNPWDDSPRVDWDKTLAFREHLYGLGFKVAEAMDTAQRGMGVDWSVARELIQRSIRHARAVGGDLACGAGTDQLQPGPSVTLSQVEAAYREQMAVVEAEGGRMILMASRALNQVAAGPDDFLTMYGRLLRDVSRPVVLHWLGEMFDPALKGYWGSQDLSKALETVLTLIQEHTKKIEGIKVSLLDPIWELSLRRRLPEGVKMYTGDDFNYAELIAGDSDEKTGSYSHGLLGIFDPIAPVASMAMSALASGNRFRFRELMDPTVALARELFRAPTRHYKSGVVFLAWLNGHQDHFSMAAGAQSARDVVHYANVFALADQCGALQDPDKAITRMRRYLSVAAGLED